MDHSFERPASIAFGCFQVLPYRRALLADGQPIRLGGRDFDVLMALIEARSEVISKDALMARVGPDRVVEENNQQARISALRATNLRGEPELMRQRSLCRMPVCGRLTAVFDTADVMAAKARLDALGT